ncbi:hypothetical protein DV515_00002816, partial [Chloebia gouldiae]
MPPVEGALGLGKPLLIPAGLGSASLSSGLQEALVKNYCASAVRLLERRPSPAHGHRTPSLAGGELRETVPQASGIYSKKVDPVRTRGVRKEAGSAIDLVSVPDIQRRAWTTGKKAKKALQRNSDGLMQSRTFNHSKFSIAATANVQVNYELPIFDKEQSSDLGWQASILAKVIGSEVNFLEIVLVKARENCEVMRPW